MPDQLLKDDKGAWDTGRIALIVTILIQLIATIWWTSKLDSRVGILELQVVANTTSIARLDIAREASVLSQTRSDDRNQQNTDMLKILINRGNNLHPEFQSHDSTKAPQ